MSLIVEYTPAFTSSCDTVTVQQLVLRGPRCYKLLVDLTDAGQENSACGPCSRALPTTYPNMQQGEPLQRDLPNNLIEGDRREAAELIQKTFRGHRARRELQGHSLSPTTKWLEVRLFSTALRVQCSPQHRPYAMPNISSRPSHAPQARQLTHIRSGNE